MAVPNTVRTHVEVKLAAARAARERLKQQIEEIKRYQEIDSLRLAEMDAEILEIETYLSEKSNDGLPQRERPNDLPKGWEEFRAAGLLWWVNRMLHLFGWSLVV